jgi:hypothetical protein
MILLQFSFLTVKYIIGFCHMYISLIHSYYGYARSLMTLYMLQCDRLCCEFPKYKTNKQTNKQTPWTLVRERTIPTERPPLVDEI